MAITAAKLGKKLTIDWTHLSSLSSNAETVGKRNQAWSKLNDRFEKNEIGFFRAPLEETLNQVAATKSLIEKLVTKTRFEDVLYLGIGGSSLGPLTLIQALEDRVVTDAPRIHFLENPDPLVWQATLKKLNPATTLVCGVTKSGTTFETLSQLLCAMEWLGRERWTTNILLITDPTKGDLRKLANAEKLPVLEIAPSIGGRFSVFTPVGIVPLLLSGLSADQFILGAKEVHDSILKTPLEKSPLFQIAESLIAYYPEKKIHVFMPYSNRLKSVGSWFVQLWGESLGKDLKGFTPVAAVGATDQHSILQLLRDGPNDKVTCFLTIDSVKESVISPKLSWKEVYPALQQVEGVSFENLLQIEYQATAKVLTNRGRPHFSMRLDDLTESSMGALLFTLCSLTAITGTLWGVDPFDQPGVEEAKVYIREMLQAKKMEETDSDQVHRLRLSRQDS